MASPLLLPARCCLRLRVDAPRSDWRNATLYIDQLDFSAFEQQLTVQERKDVWYM